MAHHHHEINGKNLLLTVILNVIITFAQIVGGIISGSLALLSDAMHNLSDVLSLMVAWIANRMAARPGDISKTFGFKRAEIIAALFNASLLMGIALFLIIEAIGKFIHPEPVDSVWVIWLGLLSIVLNSISVLLIKDEAHDNMNIKAAYLHLLSDVATSVAVVVGGILIQWWHIYWIDPLISLMIACYLVWASSGIIKESIAILMEFSPKGIDLQSLAKDVECIDGVKNIHHIHIWRLNDHDIFLEAHIDFTKNFTLQEAMRRLERIEEMLKEKYHIAHVTLQPEYRKNDLKELVITP